MNFRQFFLTKSFICVFCGWPIYIHFYVRLYLQNIEGSIFMCLVEMVLKACKSKSSSSQQSTKETVAAPAMTNCGAPPRGKTKQLDHWLGGAGLRQEEPLRNHRDRSLKCFPWARWVSGSQVVVNSVGSEGSVKTLLRRP